MNKYLQEQSQVKDKIIHDLGGMYSRKYSIIRLGENAELKQLCDKLTQENQLQFEVLCESDNQVTQLNKRNEDLILQLRTEKIEFEKLKVSNFSTCYLEGNGLSTKVIFQLWVSWDNEVP